MPKPETVDGSRASALLCRRVADQHPKPHAHYVVERGGRFFTATPCYGMHEPWWVVRTMPDSWPNEADPVPMQDDDRWWPLDDFRAVFAA